MTSITIDVREAGECLQQLTDAVLHGNHVLITRDGEPGALVTLEYLTNEGPPAGLRQVVLAVLDGAVKHLTSRTRAQRCCRN